MSDTTPVKRWLTLAWSIGLSLLFLGITTVLLLPATKSARGVIERQESEKRKTTSAGTGGSADAVHGVDRATPAQAP